jgi:hypothetical protein
MIITKHYYSRNVFLLCIYYFFFPIYIIFLLKKIILLLPALEKFLLVSTEITDWSHRLTFREREFDCTLVLD